MVTKVVIIVLFLVVRTAEGEESPNVTVINHHHHHHHHHYIYRTLQAIVFFRNILSNASLESLANFPQDESMANYEPEWERTVLEERSENPMSLDTLEKAFTKDSVKRSVATLKFRRSTDLRTPVRVTTEESTSRKRESKIRQMSAQIRPSVSQERPVKPLFTVQKAPMTSTTSRTTTRRILIGMMKPVQNTRQPKTKPSKSPRDSEEISIDRITEFGMAEQECSYGEFRGDDGECYSAIEF